MDYETGKMMEAVLGNQKAIGDKLDELLVAVRKLANATVEKVNQDVVYEAAPERPPKPRPPIEKPRSPLPPRKPPRRYDDEEDDEEIDDDEDPEEL